MSTAQRPITPATTAEWRRRRETSAADPPPSPNDGNARNGHDAGARNGLRVPAYAVTLGLQDAASPRFAESQQAGLAAMIGIAQAHAPLGAATHGRAPCAYA